MLIKKFMTAAFSLAAIAACGSQVTPSVEWVEGIPDPDTGMAVHEIRIAGLSGMGEDWTLWFSMNPEGITEADGSEACIEEYIGPSHRISPKEGVSAKDTLVVRYNASALKRHSWAPEGFILQTRNDVKPLEASYRFLPDERGHEEPWPVHEVSPLDIVPSLKDVSKPGGEMALASDLVINAVPEFESVSSFLSREYTSLQGLPDGQTFVYFSKCPDSHVHGWYSIALKDDITITAADEDGAFYAAQSLLSIASASNSGVVPKATVKDWPDLQYRGMMLDVARNFTTKDNVLRLIDALARYKVNVFHLHLCDDEGWRLAVDGIDELTSVGAFHSLDGSALQPSYNGNADRNDEQSSSNGFYTKEEFIEILKYAAERHVRVIPELDVPGHSRAAIRAMAAYEMRTGDSSMRLSDPADESEYYSAQAYKDNVLCVAYESVYTFIERITDYISGLYAAAGVPFEVMHYGGDEVPEGSWTKSPVAQEFMAANGMTRPEELRDYFIRRIAGIAAERNLKIMGWQEMTSGVSEQTKQVLRPVLLAVNCWNTVPSWGGDEAPYQIANDGFGVILSNVTNTYADQVYSSDRYERGHSWACTLNEKNSFALLPYDIYRSTRDENGNFWPYETKAKLKDRGMIKGVSVQLFAETIRSFDDVTYQLFPKVVGAFERAWNADPTWSHAKGKGFDDGFESAFVDFNSILMAHEVPFWESMGFEYRVRK